MSTIESKPAASLRSAEGGEPRPFRFNREQFDQMIKLGWVDGRTTILFDGEVLEPVDGNGQGHVKKHWTLEQYYEMAELGWFPGGRAMLLDGEILQMAIQGPGHYLSVHKTEKVLRGVFGDDYWVRTQAPLELKQAPTDSDTEPDVSVVEGKPEDYKDRHPTYALLAVEASDSTLSFDRGRKAAIYARAQIADYWIINLIERKLEVCRNPVSDPDQPYGFRYADVAILEPTDYVVPLAAPQARILVSDLLP